MKQHAWQVLSAGMHNQVLLNQLQGVLAGRHTVFALVIVDRNGLLVVKNKLAWEVPRGAMRMGPKEFFEGAMSRILPRGIIDPRPESVKKVDVLGMAAADDIHGKKLLSVVDVERSCVIHNAKQDHTWARSMGGLKTVLSAGESDDDMNEIVLFGAQEAVKRGFLNWGQGATAH